MDINAAKFDSIARTVFAPVYPVIAAQIIAHTGITGGVCLDIGCGSGYLGAALAKTTGLFVYFLDVSSEMLAVVRRTITENGLENRADILQGDVSAIALPDDSVDLAVSRGSIFFWKDLVAAFREIDRVLAPGGQAYIGGGFGTKELKEGIERKMALKQEEGDENFRKRVTKNLGDGTRERFSSAVTAAGITSCTILQNEDIGLWLVMQKQASK